MNVTEIKNNAPKTRKPREVYYPEGDGKPMAETVEHRVSMTYGIEAASISLSNVPNVWINGNDFVYYVQGDPRKRVSPDLYVVLDVPRGARRFFKVWEEGGRTPNLVVEYTSRDTAREDRETKFDLYQNVLKVDEYILFDPLDQYLRPRLQGYRLVNGVYQAIAPTAEGHLVSQQTGIRMYPEGYLLRFINPQTGETIMTRDEAEGARFAETQRAQAEARRAEAAEAEIERLRALVASLQKSGNDTPAE